MNWNSSPPQETEALSYRRPHHLIVSRFLLFHQLREKREAEAYFAERFPFCRILAPFP